MALDQFNYNANLGLNRGNSAGATFTVEDYGSSTSNSSIPDSSVSSLLVLRQVMRPPLQRVSCFLHHDLTFTAAARSRFTTPQRSDLHASSARSSPTRRTFASFSHVRSIRQTCQIHTTQLGQSRAFSISRIHRKEEWPKVSVTDPAAGQPSAHEASIAKPETAATEIDDGLSTTTTSKAATVPLNGSSVRPARQEDLPSHIESQRSRVVRWFNRMMDDLVPRLVMAGQKINSFTGTDYTGIEELRREIRDQEQLVRARNTALLDAKAAFDAAYTVRADCQKEVVGLLERKQNWSNADLERYMTLFRSEHINDQAVQASKDAVSAAEKALEEARSRLEKRERAQYHEEQIWSDTIRRNSTWLTFGLMGFNIFLLLLNVVVLEPWRRRKIVREIKGALDEKSVAHVPSAFAADNSVTPSEKDREAPPYGEELEHPEIAMMEEEIKGSVNQAKARGTPEQVLIEQTRTAEDQQLASLGNDPVAWARGLSSSAKQRIGEHLSQEPVTLRRVDMTVHVVEGAVAGAAIMGLLFALFAYR